MRIGNQTRIDSVQEADLEDFARTLKVKPGVVVDKAHRLIDGANSAWECMGALPELDGHQPLLMALRKGWAERATRLFQ